MSSYKSEAPGQSDRTALRLTARLQRQRQAFDALGPLVALGETEEARRRLRATPLDDVRKASTEIALLRADPGAAQAAQRKFTAAVDRLDSQLMRAGRRERSNDGLENEYAEAIAEFDSFLAQVGVPKPERQQPKAVGNTAPASLR